MVEFMSLLIGLVAVVLIFGMPAFIILGWIWLKERTKVSAHKVITLALEKGQPLDPKVMDSLVSTVPQAKSAKPQDRVRRSMGSAIVMFALAIGFTGASFILGELDFTGYHHGLLAPAAFILAVLGLGFLTLALLDRNANKNSEV